MPRTKWLLFILGGLFLVMAAWMWARQLGPAEAAVVGTWTSSLHADGSTTLVHLGSDRACRVRWLDDAGKDTAHSPRDGYWWVEGKTLFVDVSSQPSFLEFLFVNRKKGAAAAWPFLIQDETLVLTINTPPVVLRRSPDEGP